MSQRLPDRTPAGAAMRDRRALFFLLAAAAAAALTPLSEHELRWVPEAVSATYVILALLSFLDALGRARET
jgi:uncharacterized membrane protein YhfC